MCAPGSSVCVKGGSSVMMGVYGDEVACWGLTDGASIKGDGPPALEERDAKLLGKLFSVLCSDRLAFQAAGAVWAKVRMLRATGMISCLTLVKQNYSGAEPGAGVKLQVVWIPPTAHPTPNTGR